MKVMSDQEYEIRRLTALKALSLSKTLPEQEFDEIAQLATKICDTPLAYISFIDQDRQWFKAKIGFSILEIPRSQSFCEFTIQQHHVQLFSGQMLIQKFKNNPLFSLEPNIQFYAGISINDPQHGLPIGTLAILDTKKRELTQDQNESLKILKTQIERFLYSKIPLNSYPQIESKLIETNQRQNYILNGAGLGSWDWWLETNEVQFDRRWCEMLGLKLEETPQNLTTWDSRVHPEDKAQAYEDIKSYLNGKTAYYENIHRMMHANGEWIWILDRGRISEWDLSGKPIRFTGIHLEITEYKNNELLSAEIQRIGNIGGWELDIETNKIKWTDQTYRIHALPTSASIDEMSGDHFFPELELKKIRQLVEKCKVGIPYQETFEFVDAEGVHKWVEATGNPILDSTGKVKSLRGTFQDVTSKVEAENAIEASRLKALHSAKLASLGEMSAGIAHEINNPLTIISSTLPLLKKFREDEARFNIKIESIDKATQRVSKIVNGLRKYSRSSDATEMKSNSIEELIHEVLIICETKAKRNSTLLKTDIKATSKVQCDASEIEQVLINLINNGIDAVTNLNERWVQINLFEEANHVIIQVLDSGLGISSDIEDKLFQPFFTTKPVGEGTGLGLSICKGILDNHNAIFKLNKNFKNTCFEIRFKTSKMETHAN